MAILSCSSDDAIVDPLPVLPDPPPSEFISSVLPQKDASNQSVWLNPVIVFKYKIGEVVNFPNNSTNYKLVFDEAKIEPSTDLNIALEWTQNKDSLKLLPEALLHAQTNYTISVKTHWEEEKSSGIWEPVKVNNQVQSLTHATAFITENKDISKILTDNIKYTYPIANQYNFLKSEYAKGYVILNTSLQNNLFEGAAQFIARFSTPGQSNVDVSLTFNSTALTLEHNIPANLINETIYKLEYLKIPNGGTAQELYSVHFRTSKFNTFIEKMDSYTLSNTFSWETTTGATEIYVKLLNQTEYFDNMEAKAGSVQGMYYSVGMIQFEALSGNTWYDEKIFPLLYENVSTSGLTWKRNQPTLKVPPINGLYIRRAASYSDPFISYRQLTAEEIQNNQSTPWNDSGAIIYNLAPIIAYDYSTLRALAANASTQNAYTQKLLNTSYPQITHGTYQAKIKYILPGQSVANSEKIITFNYN